MKYHIFYAICEVEADSLEDVFDKLQNSKHYRSMSAGDLIEQEDGSVKVVAPVGFDNWQPATKKFIESPT